jgi:putative tryptophan/tyrosine transport system substrate-binding protein
METLGILHSGSPRSGQVLINEITELLKDKCKTRIRVADWKDNLSARAKSLMDVDVLLAADGSRSAHAAIHKRRSADKPIIVFTSVAPYILDEIDPTTTTGVCAHTSDHDGERLELLLEMLQYIFPTIGVLRNSNRGDAGDQWQAINDAAQFRCSLVDADLNGPLTIRKAFDLFQKKGVDALLVAADPLLYHHRREVVDGAKKANYPAIYQWREFVKVGGLMSYGPNRKECYDRALQMVIDICNSGDPPKIPPVWEAEDDDFELVVSEATARHVGRWPLPAAIANHKPEVLP